MPESTLRLRPVTGRGRPVALKGEPVSIGRHPENTFAIKDEKASRQHCVLEPDDDGNYVVRDLNSRNGTFVNGARLERAVLAPGDVIRVGAHEFAVEVAEPGTDADPPTPRRAGAPAPEPSWAGEIRALIASLPGKDPEHEEQVALLDASQQASAALAGGGEGSRALTLILRASSRARATDIHMEPKGEHVSVRMRVDGEMVWIVDLPVRVGSLVFGIVKTACQMKQAAQSAVLEGHFGARYPDRRVDFRVSFTPSVHGPKCVMRVLDRRSIPTSLAELGLPPYMHERVRRTCEQDHGLLLVCGPTGSGKTTTLYNCLREIDRERLNVVTIEDPVEYQLEGVTQMPIDEARGNSFGSLLRSVLRQDPDVILVGEIRDEETARTAMQAAMTGHVVFSTVHAKDTISAVFRLLDLRVEPFLIASSLDVVLAQRLVRVLCEHCKTPVPVTPGQSTRLGRFLAGRTQLYAATGCARCLRTGFRGRRAIFELLDFTDELRDVVIKEPSITAMKRVIEQGLFTTLVQSGWKLAADGVTSLDEIDHVCGLG